MLTTAVETAVCDREIADASAWTGESVQREDGSFVTELTPEEVSDVQRALRHFSATGKPLRQLEREDFPLPVLSTRLAELRREVTDGRGFAILRGLPVGAGVSEDEAKVVHWALARHMGRAVPQNSRGHLLGHVIAKEGAGAKRRSYESTAAQVYHSDGSDVVGLLCVRQAKSGGGSTIASSVTIHNVLRREHPELLARLYRTYYHSRMGEEVPGQTPYHPCPVYTYVEGYLNCRPGTSYIKDAQRFDEVPRLTDTDLEALETWKSIPLRTGIALNYRLQPGDIQFLNNYTVVHGRSEYVDHDEPDRRRYLVRILARVEQPRAFTPELEARRGGIPLAPGVEPDIVMDPDAAGDTLDG